MKKSQRQERAIKALSCTGSITEAAEIAGVTRRTLYNYLKEPWFRKELERMYESSIIEQVFDFEDQKRRAEDVLAELMENDDPNIRLRAAKVSLDNARKREIMMLRIMKEQKQAAETDIWNFFS